MKTKRCLFYMAAILLPFVAVVCLYSCKGDGNNNKKDKQQADKIVPWNITVLIDLSDRITDSTENRKQEDNDVQLIVHIANTLKDKIAKEKFIGRDNFKILFYPNPNLDGLGSVTTDLRINMDVPRKEKKEQKRKLQKLDSLYTCTLHNVYTQAKQKAEYPGSDIWGFFRMKAAEQCIRNDYRNILVILTDGYIYHKDNKRPINGKPVYVTPISLEQNPNIELANPLEGREKLNSLEVLLLEVNPKNTYHFELLERILTKWFDDMGVNKFKIITKGDPSVTKDVIDTFLQIR